MSVLNIWCNMSVTVLHKSEDDNSYSLPKATTFEEVNKNFETISDITTRILSEIKEHSEATNENITRLATETRENLDKVGEDMKSILSSQTMMLTIVCITICLLIIIGKGIYEAAAYVGTSLL